MATLGVDKSQFTSGLNSAKGEAMSKGREIGGALSSAIGGALTVGGITMAFNSILQKVSDIRKASTETGFSTDAIQKFNFELRQMNIEIASGQTALGKMNQLIGQAQEKEQKAVETFARWGISINGKSNAEIFNDIRESILATEDPAKRVAEAMEIFGKGGREMLPLLTASKDELDQMAAHAPIISKDDLDSLERAKQLLEEIKDRILVMGAKGLGGVAAGAASLGAASGTPNLRGDDWFWGSNRGEDSIFSPADKLPKKDKGKSGPGSLAFMAGLKNSKGDIINDILNMATGGLMSTMKIGPLAKKDSPGESHRASKMMELNSMQKIGAYEASPPGYQEMVRASLSAEKHIASIDKKTPAAGRGKKQTQF